MLIKKCFSSCPASAELILVFALVFLGFTERAWARGMQGAEEQDLEAASRLAELWRFVEKECKANQIPGLALAVVREDRVLLSKTLGFADREKKIPVKPDTVFPIGSCAKPFTSTLTAMAVSDGTLGWDDPVTRYLPYFRLAIESKEKSDQVTIRDLLSHRTGFFTMELIQEAVNWSQDPDYDKRDPSTRLTRESLLKKAATFKPKDPFRRRHNYSNVSMLAAALATGKAAGTDWDTLIEERMFKPLGMTRSTTSITRIPEGHPVAVGYLFEGETYQPAMLINMDLISPAGGVNSTLEDMTRWLRFLLAEGELDGKRHLDAEALCETWTVHIGKADLDGMMPGASYGLGWFVKKRNALPVLEHGGNALGYSALVALIPDEKVGFVMLSNALPNPLQFTLSEHVWSAVIPDEEE